MLSKTMMVLGAFLLIAVTAAAQADEAKPAAPFYGNATCPISGKPVNKEIWAEKDGERIYLCCMNCKGKVDADWAGSLAKAYPKEKVRDLKNARCPMMGDRDAKEDVTLDFQGHRIRFCCKNCMKKFRTEPNKSLTLALDPALKVVGNTMCPVMEQEKVEPDHFVVYKGKIVNLCCGDCVGDFAKTPDAFLEKAEKQAKGK